MNFTSIIYIIYSDQKVTKVWKGSYFFIQKVLSIGEAVHERSFFEINWSPILQVAFLHLILVHYQAIHHSSNIHVGDGQWHDFVANMQERWRAFPTRSKKSLIQSLPWFRFFFKKLKSS